MKMTGNIIKNSRLLILLTLLFALLALTVLTQANPGTELPSRDYGFYTYIGKQIVKGHMLYYDVWDHKPPAIYYLNAFALRLGRGLRWGIWLVEFVFLFAAIASSFYLLNKLWGITPALFGILVWLWGMDFTLEGGNFTEEYPLTFHFLALILLLKLTQTPDNRFFNLTLGLLLSISILFRPNNAIVEAVVILVFAATLLLKKNFRAFLTSAFWIALGSIIPIGLTSAYFAYHGLLYAMFEASILYNLAYSGIQLTATSPLLIGFEYLNLAAWIGLVGYFLLIIRIKDHFRSPNFSLFIVLLVGMPLTVFLSDPAKRNYGHYFMNWLPFIALLSGYALHIFQEKLVSPKNNPPSFLPLFSLLFISLAFFVFNGRAVTYQKALDRLFTSSESELRSPVAIYVENHTRPGEYVLFWATHPGENFMSRRDAPHSSLFYPMLVDSEISERLNDDFFDDIKRNTPVLVVDMGRLTIPSLNPQKREEQIAGGLGWMFPPDNLEEVLRFIEENYYLEAVIKEKPIYRLRGTSKP
jgi:hypothetical protein